MFEYPKTENLFLRDEDTHKLIVGAFRQPEFAIPKFWHVTEKIDGTNCRVVYDPLGATVDYRGRSDRATMKQDLIDSMAAVFTLEKMQRQFDEYLGPEKIEAGTKVTIFGEGYGPGIQQGGYYGGQRAFRMFDVVYHRPRLVREPIDSVNATVWEWFHSWCQPETVKMIAGQLGAETAPVISEKMDLLDIVRHVKALAHGAHPVAALDPGGQDYIPEGVIARTDPYLYDEHGRRVMFKLKVCDL